MILEHLPQPVPRGKPEHLVAAIDRVELALASATELPALTELHAGIQAIEQMARLCTWPRSS